MDIYANPSSNTYVTGITKRFMMPTDSGGIPAVAVSSRSASLIVSAYTIMILFIFMVGWNLILAVIMGFWPTRHNPNRYIVLVALWNSGESMNAAMMMLEYCIRMISGRSQGPGGARREAPRGAAGRIPSSNQVKRSGPSEQGTTKGGEPTAEREAPRSTAGRIPSSGQAKRSGLSEQGATKGGEPTAERETPRSAAGRIPASSQGQHSDPSEQDTVKGEKPTTAAQIPQQSPKSSTPNRKPGVSNLWWGILFFFIALAMSVGNIAASILVAGELLMGNVAPAAKEAIFYPDVKKYSRTDDSGVSLAKLASLRAPSALRAFGSIGDSDVTVRKRVNLGTLEPPGNGNGSGPDGPWLGRTYEYDVTGVDMGLQTEPKLRLKVRGSCQTEYTWLNDSTDAADSYKLFGGDQSHSVQFQPDVKIPPMVDFMVNEKDVESKNPNITFAMIVNTGGRYSYTPGEDVWFYTEPTRDTSLPYVVRRRRPVFSCWETRRWHLKGKVVETSEIDKLPGLRLHKLWIDVFKWEFAVPRMVSLGKAAGSGALKSATYSVAPDFILDAGSSSTEKDFERLVLASWASSRNVLRDTTTYEEGGMAAMSEGPRGGVEADAAKFVLRSGDVATLSVRILISVPAILLFLLVVEMCLRCVPKHKCLGRSSIFRNYATRGMALHATQLYRHLDEELYGRARWSHRLSRIPAMYEPYDDAGSRLPVDEENQYLPGSARSRDNQKYQRADLTGVDGKSPEVKEAGVSCLYDCAEPRLIMRTIKSPDGSAQTAELTISRRADPEVSF